MRRLLEEAKWMDGAVWTLLMVTVFAAYEIFFRNVAPDSAYWLKHLAIWGLAGAGYAILAGWLARRNAENSNTDS